MPPKDINLLDAKIKIGVCGHEFGEWNLVDLNRIEPSCSEVDFPYNENILSGEHECSITLCPPQGLTCDDIILALIYGISIEKLKQNNWRKFHGLPMRRRKR